MRDGREDTGRRRWLQGAASGALLAAAPAWAQASATRVAVVIGNSAYPTGALINPTRDAAAMSVLLRSIGFEVVEARDAGKAEMEAAVARAQALLTGRQGVGMLYYAGHGLQLDWRNFMLPVDAAPAQAADVARQAIDVQAVVQAFGAAGNRMNILVLDACRDNPFPASAAGKGLAPMDAPPGTFFAYATAPGNVADDGDPRDGNGLYTRYLLQELRRPEARIEDVFKRVRLQVRQASQGRQIPWESTSLEDDFVFATGNRAEVAAGARREAEFVAEIADWERVKDSRRAEDLYAFLQRHPNGRISEVAQFRLDQLSRPAVQPLQKVSTLPPGVDRYRVGDQWEMERIDHLAGGQREFQPFRVTAIEGQRVLINGGAVVVDQMGGVILNPNGAKDPPVMVVPADLQVGKRWRSAFTNQRANGPRTQNFYDYRVLALEEVEVPAGRFLAYRLEGIGQAVFPNQTMSLRNVIWVDPATMLPVRQISHQSLSDGTVTQNFTWSLRRRQLVPRV